MEHDLTVPRARLLKSKAYTANSNCNSAFSWHTQKNGDILIDKTSNANAVLAVVGEVLENRLDCTPSGNYHEWDRQTLAKSKYHLLLGKPMKTPFADDFDAAIKNLTSFQNAIAVWPDRENLIVFDKRQRALRFTREIFEERHPAVAESEVDELTERWPIESKFVGLLNDIKCTHRAVPLRVFLKNKLVDARRLNDILTGAVIEIQFELQHFSIHGKKIESFNASMQQVQVLRPGESRPPTAFKRQDISEGPIQVSESLDIDEYEEPPFSKKTRTGSRFVATEKESSESENEKASSSAKKLGKRVAKDWTDEDGEKK